ncbi:MAG: SURF1 family protein [Rubrivivax sp.]
MLNRRLVVLISAVLTAGITARLGFWQLDRAAQKSALQAAVESRQQLPPLKPEELPANEKTLQESLHRQITLQGVWAPQHTVYLENRQMQGRPGFFVVTPLLLPDGDAVLVQRGWLPRDLRDRTRVQAPATEAGATRLLARIALPPARLYDFGGTASGPIRQNLDVGVFALETGLKLRPLSVLELDEAPVATAGQPPRPDKLLRAWPLPASDIHKHHGYAFQWFAFSALTIALYVWFQILRPRRRGAPAGGAAAAQDDRRVDGRSG